MIKVISNSVAQAIKTIIKVDGGNSVTDAADKLRIARPALSNVIHGKARLSPLLAAKIERVYKVGTMHLLAEQLRIDFMRAQDEARQLYRDSDV